MNPQLGRWMMTYGLFLIAMGVLGYLSNPQKAATALISGGTFGTLSFAWGWLMARGTRWAYWAACATTGMLLAVFSWRATVSWLAVTSVTSDKLAAATLITLMGLASLTMLGLLALRRAPAPRPAASA